MIDRMVDRKIDETLWYSPIGGIVKPDVVWGEVTQWLAEKRRIGLPKGGDFEVSFDDDTNSIEIVPIETGIPRRVSREEWRRFVDRFNEVKKKGYDPLRPGHYADITHNSSYLVAVLKELEYSE